MSEKLDDMMVFRNWFNEQHSKTTSVKVRAARRICAESGKFLGAYAPYGYKKSPENRHKLVVDEITAPVVRSLFEMRVAGMGFRAIAMKLNDDGILPPREYYYRGKGVRNPRKTNCVWSETTVQDIIRNEAYIGNTVQGKAGTISFKNHRQKAKPKEEWIKAQGTHEPLVALELWERAQSFTHRNYRPRRRNDGGTNLFAGLLYCADCGFKLRGQVERTLRKDGTIHGVQPCEGFFRDPISAENLPDCSFQTRPSYYAIQKIVGVSKRANALPPIIPIMPTKNNK